MPAEVIGFEQLENKLGQMFAGMAEGLKDVGEAMAAAIVQTTLAGIGENDEPFAPYSEGYKAQLDAVGGKQRGLVDMRGIFYHEGQKQKKFKSEEAMKASGAGRQGFVGVRFAAKTDFAAAAGGKAAIVFTAKTAVTRPQVSLTDKFSELSLDLIKIESTDTSLRLIYSPRKDAYMITHHNGEGKMPARPWFSANKAAVKTAANSVLTRIFGANIQWFNDHTQSGPPPTGVVSSPTDAA